MIVTEQEASTKRCQESFGDNNVTSTGHIVAVNMYGGGGTTAIGTSPSMCLGAACMAWCWFDNLDDEAIKQPRGYCGKAGKP